MASETRQSDNGAHPQVISVDAMGGDRGPNVVVDGMARAAAKHPEIRYVVHGDENAIRRRIDKRKQLRGRCEIRHCDGIVTMAERPGEVIKRARNTSMWSAIETVRNGDAPVAVSCGNTGALMLVSVARLKRAPGVDRPAIACLWPSRNKSGFNVLLDVGADIRADENDLARFAEMGATYARNGLGLERPRIGLLNVGTEAHKGRSEIKAANEKMPGIAEANGFDYVGFVEGGDIPSSRVDVVVTDGFTGNVILKSVEGTANLIKDFLRQAFTHTPLSPIGALFAYTPLRRLYRRIDPRRMNGGVFLGLNGLVVKSHGSADAVGVAAAIGLAVRLATKSTAALAVPESQPRPAQSPVSVGRVPVRGSAA